MNDKKSWAYIGGSATMELLLHEGVQSVVLWLEQSKLQEHF